MKGSSASGKDPAFADQLSPTSSWEVQCCVVIQKKSKKGPSRSFHKVTNLTRVDSIPVTYSLLQGLHHSKTGSYSQRGMRVGIVKWPRDFPLLISILGRGLVLNFLFPYPIFSMSKCLDRLCHAFSYALSHSLTKTQPFHLKGAQSLLQKRWWERKEEQRPESGAVVLKSHSTPQLHPW